MLRPDRRERMSTYPRQFHLTVCTAVCKCTCFVGIQDLTEIQCGIRENAKFLYVIRELTATREADSPKSWHRMRYWERKRYSGRDETFGVGYCGEREREYGIRTPPPPLQTLGIQ